MKLNMWCDKCCMFVGETHHSHLGEGALDAVGHGHSGWTHVSVSLYKVVNGPAHTHTCTHTTFKLEVQVASCFLIGGSTNRMDEHNIFKHKP